MRRFTGITLSLLAVCLLAGNVALAQGRGRGGMGRMMFQQTPAALIGNEAVQKELKLNDDQVAKAKEIRDEMFQGFRRGGGGGGQNLSDEERAKRFEEAQKKNKELSDKAMALLTPEQTARMKQIEIWANGVPHALTQNEEVVKQLNLTDDQKGAIKTIDEEAGKKRQEIFGGFRGADEETRGKLMAQMAEIGKETEAECLAVLTDDQKAHFDKLRGPKFEMPPFGGGRGRRGRPGGTN